MLLIYGLTLRVEFFLCWVEGWVGLVWMVWLAVLVRGVVMLVVLFVLSQPLLFLSLGQSLIMCPIAVQ